MGFWEVCSVTDLVPALSFCLFKSNTEQLGVSPAVSVPALSHPVYTGRDATVSAWGQRLEHLPCMPSTPSLSDICLCSPASPDSASSPFLSFTGNIVQQAGPELQTFQSQLLYCPPVTLDKSPSTISILSFSSVKWNNPNKNNK